MNPANVTVRFIPNWKAEESRHSDSVWHAAQDWPGMLERKPSFQIEKPLLCGEWDFEAHGHHYTSGYSCCNQRCQLIHSYDWWEERGINNKEQLVVRIWFNTDSASPRRSSRITRDWTRSIIFMNGVIFLQRRGFWFSVGKFLLIPRFPPAVLIGELILFFS